MRDKITGVRVANAIKFMASRKPKGISVLVVEGKSDKKFFGKFIDDNCCIIEIAHGKDNVIDAVTILNQQNKSGILGIVDADHHRIHNDQRLNERNILVTDTCDVETMIIRTRAFFSILAEHGSKDTIRTLEKNKGKSLRELIVEGGILIGLLRLYSLKNNLELSFKEIDFNRFINRRTFELDEREFINEVFIKTKANKISKEKIEDDFKSLKKEHYFPWDLCCGHDLTQILRIGLLSIFGSDEVKGSNDFDVEEKLRLSYQFEFFSKTSLYNEIINWQTGNIPYKIILDEENFYYVS